MSNSHNVLTCKMEIPLFEPCGESIFPPPLGRMLYWTKVASKKIGGVLQPRAF
jgi:hypothetical protein